MSEKEIVNRAVQNLKHFIYIDMDTLIENIQQLFPTVAVLVVVNNDDRDGNNIPRVTYKTVNKMSVTIHKTRSYAGRGRLLQEIVTGFSGLWDHVLCVVQDGCVTVKRNRLRIGD